MSLARQPVLHVEARVKTNRDGLIIRTDLVGFDLISTLQVLRPADQGRGHTLAERELRCSLPPPGDPLVR